MSVPGVGLAPTQCPVLMTTIIHVAGGSAQFMVAAERYQEVIAGGAIRVRSDDLERRDAWGHFSDGSP